MDWIAATGGTAVARRAGPTTDTAVTPRPTATPATAVRGSNTTESSGSATPSATISRWRPMPSRTPSPRPSADAAAPTTSPSPITEAATCRRDAPTARSRASSRVRWATTIVNVFQIRNALTNNVTPANPSRSPTKLVSSSSMSAWAAATSASELNTDTDGPPTFRSADCTSSDLAPGSRPMLTTLYQPGTPTSSPARSEEKASTDAAVISPVPRCSAIPEMRASTIPRRVATRTRSPNPSPRSAAVSASITTSSGPLGALPDASRTPNRSGSTGQLLTSEKSKAPDRPPLSSSWPGPDTMPSATATPGTEANSGSRAAGTPARDPPKTPPGPPVDPVAARTTMSERPAVSRSRSRIERARLSVSTNAATTKATPTTTAVAVRTNRRQWARAERRANRNIAASLAPGGDCRGSGRR